VSTWPPTASVREEATLLTYWTALWRRKWIIVLTTIVALGIAVAVDHARTPKYSSTAQLLFLSQGSSTAATSASGGLATGQISTDIQLVQSTEVQAKAAKILRSALPTVSVAEIGTTQVAGVTVTSPDKAFAAQAANAYAQAYIDVTTSQYLTSQLVAQTALQKQLTTIQGRITTLSGQLNSTVSGSPASASLTSQLSNLYAQQALIEQQIGALQVATSQNSAGGQIVQPATVSSSPSSPKRLRDALIGGAAGLILGIGFALTSDFLDDRIRDKTQLEELIPGIPVLGLIPVIDGWRDRKKPYLVAQTHPKSPPTEAYRGLRTSVQFMALENPTKVLQITSPSAGDGKTTTSANLAWIMAEAGQRVVLVGCDLRRPRIHEFFGLPNDIGFTSVLLGEAELEDAVLRVPNQPRLQLLPTGPVPPNPSELLSSAKTREIFNTLGAYADIVVVDSAPILPVTDAAVLSTNADAVLLVVSSGMDRRRDTIRSIELLKQINAPLVGTVLNRAPETDSYAYYHYGYGYSEKSSSKESAKTNGKVRAPAANGKGAVVESTTSLDFPGQESGHVEWPSMGRHAKLGEPTPDMPSLLPETGDAPSE
jgi:non-specific protein-tyrosine kinase